MLGLKIQKMTLHTEKNSRRRQKQSKSKMVSVKSSIWRLESQINEFAQLSMSLEIRIKHRLFPEKKVYKQETKSKLGTQLKDSQTHPNQCAEFHYFVHSIVLGLLQAGRPKKQHSKNTNRCTFGSWPFIITFLSCVQIWHKTLQGWRFKGTIDLSQVSPAVWCWSTGDIHDILLMFSVIFLSKSKA